MPHAHEPAGTVGCMNFVSQLLTGKHLDGCPSTLVQSPVIAWADLEREAALLALEVQNNSPKTPHEMQLLLMDTAPRAPARRRHVDRRHRRSGPLLVPRGGGKTLFLAFRILVAVDNSCI